MKDNQPVYDLIRGEYQVEVVPRVYAEWNQNAFNYTECDNDVTGGEDETGYDIEIFPIRSIAQPWRPQRAGICKAVINQSATEPTAKDDDTPMSRYYIVSTDDKYKYWQSPEESSATVVSGEYAIANCKPFVKYVEEYDEEEYDKSETKNSWPFVATNVKANKIQVVIETNSISIRTGWDANHKPIYSTRSCVPKNWQIQVRYAGNTDPNVWTTIATNLDVPTNPTPSLATDEEKEKEGRVELWLDVANASSSTWTTTKPNLGAPSEGHYVEINAIRLVVNTLSRPLASFNLIELGARLEFDVTKDVSSPDYKESLGQADFITPLGTISANDGSVKLFNGTIDDAAEDRVYSNENPLSPLYKMLDKGVKFTCDWAYRFPSGDFEFIRAFTAHSDVWEESVAETSVSIKDAAMRLQDVKPPQVLWEKIPVQEIVWRLLDICGFNDYDVSTVSVTEPSMVDIFWTTGNETVWEVLRDLSAGTQTAIYFDAYGKLQVKPRTVAFNNFKDATWTARENNYWTGTNNEIPDIITLGDDDNYEANRVDVQYQPTGFSEFKNGVYPFETVWEPTSAVTLRSAAIVRDMPIAGPTTTDAWRIWLDAGQARTWPWSGMVNIDGEWIKYEGKGFHYYLADGTRASKFVKSQEEADKLTAAAPANKRHLCTLSGSLKITERGAYNTGRQAHLSRPKSEWTARAKGAGGTETARTGGFRHDKVNHRASVEGFPNTTSSDNLRIVTHGSTLDQGYKWIGTRMRLNAGGWVDRTAGIVFNNETFTGGYYLEFMPSAKVSAKKDANYRQEVVLWSYKNNGERTKLGGQKIIVTKSEKAKGKEAKKTIKVNVGSAAAIGTDIWFDVDVRINTTGTNAGQAITVFVNGKAVLDTSIGPANEWFHPWVGRFGMFARGHSKAIYEYIYATSREFDASSTTDEESFVDRIRGGYAGQLSSIWQYDTKTIRKKIKKRWTKITQRYNQIFFEEFGAIAHEIREFDVKFNNNDTGGKTDMPVLESKILNTNDTNAAVCWYTGSPGGANFAIANTSRTAAVLNGEIGDVTHSLLIYGRPVIQKDTVTITKEDLPAIRKRGVIQTDYTSKWIQNDAEAQALATWLTTSWSLSDTILNVEVFGNPLLELTDVVDVQYRDIIAKTDDPVNGWKYYVVGINTSFDNGLKTTLTLKRVTETA